MQAYRRGSGPAREFAAWSVAPRCALGGSASVGAAGREPRSRLVVPTCRTVVQARMKQSQAIVCKHFSMMTSGAA